MDVASLVRIASTAEAPVTSTALIETCPAVWLARERAANCTAQHSWPLKFCKHSFTLFTSVAQSWFNSRGDRLTCSLTYFGPPDRYFYSPRFISSCPVYFPIHWFSLPLFGYFFAHRTPVVATPNSNIPGTPGKLGRVKRMFFGECISPGTNANVLILEPRHNF